jgi:hypothetical protein
VRGEKDMLKRHIIGIIPLLILLLVITISGCGGGDGGDSTGSPFTTSLQLKDASGQEKSSFPMGETITFVVSIKNNTSSHQTLTFSDMQKFDIVVSYPIKWRDVWRWSDDKGFGTVLSGLPFDPKETKIFVGEWDQTNSSGVQVFPNTYYAQGIIVCDNVLLNPNLDPNQFWSNLVRFEIF